MGPRLALAAFLIFLVIAAPAAAHGTVDHADSRTELAASAVTETVAGLDGTGLPTTWCGTETTADTPGTNVALPRFKVVYAYAADGTDRSAAWSNALQADISTLSRFVGAQSGGRKAPRFDMGTSCGPQYVDIQVVQLPGTRSAYVDNFSAVRTDVRARLNPTPGGPRDTVILADGLASAPIGYWSGLATVMYDDSPGATNVSNNGGLFAIMWVPNGEPVRQAGWWPEGILHEMSHNMGAVQDSAPHSSLVGHCWDGYDVMCYADGGTHPMEYPCAALGGAMGKTYDCGGDDYFNPAPPDGNYLATHWNVYRSEFLAPCADIAPACGESGGTTLTPPSNTSPPVVTGTAQVGAALSTTTGTWINAPTHFTYQWQRESGGTWSNIQSASSGFYVVRPDDLGLRLRVQVVASNADGSMVQASDPTAAVVAASSPTPAPTPTPSATPSPVTVTDPPVRTPATTPTIPLASRAAVTRATLRVTRGRGHGTSLAALVFSDVYGRVKVSTFKARLAKGRYVARLCTAYGCKTRTLKVRKTGKARVPALSAPGVPAGARYTLTGRGFRFTARATGA